MDAEGGVALYGCSESDGVPPSSSRGDIDNPERLVQTE
jgi:hypothetical protein